MANLTFASENDLDEFALSICIFDDAAIPLPMKHALLVESRIPSSLRMPLVSPSVWLSRMCCVLSAWFEK